MPPETALDLSAGNSQPSTDLVTESGQPNPKAEVTFDKAWDMYKNLVKDNQERNRKNAAAMRKRNGEQPYSSKKLKASGQGWRNNRPTGFMKTMLRRVMPPYKQMVDQLTYLTYSHFPVVSLGTEADQDIFRKVITNCWRTWNGSSDLTDQIIDEDIGFGYAAAVILDKGKWKPEMLRGDEVYFQVGAPQDVEKIEVVGIKRNIPIHKIMDILKTGRVAKNAGWRVENLIKKLNGGEGALEEFKGVEQDSYARVYQDLIQNNNLSATYTSSRKVLKTGQLLLISPRGQVSHYIFDRDDGTPYFLEKDKFGSMKECVSIFASEVADRTIQGCSGAARDLYNTHVTVEQARNLIQDALHLNGLVVLKRGSTREGAGRLEGPALSVKHPFAVIGDGYEVLEKTKFEVNTEAFLALDSHATTQAEIQLGIYMPGAATGSTKPGEKATASEINYVASIDAQIRAGILARFANQYFAMMDMVQSRICSPDAIKLAKRMFDIAKGMAQADGQMPTWIYDRGLWKKLQAAEATDGFLFAEIPTYLDTDAIQCIYEMLDQGLEPKQILILANQSSRANVDDAIAAQSGVLDMVVARYSADPVIDTTELKRRDLSAKLGAKSAERLMDVEMDPLSDVKQVRTQSDELVVMLNGMDAPLDKTDNDKLHLDVIGHRLVGMLQNPNVSPLASSKEFLQRVLVHAEGHIQAALGKGVKQSELGESIASIEKIKQILAQEPLDQQIQGAIDGGAQPGLTVPGSTSTPSGPLTPSDVAGALSDTPAPTAGDLVGASQAELVDAQVSSPGSVITSTANPQRPVPPRGQ